MNRFIILFLLVMGMSSCNSDDGVNTGNSDLVGTWNWTGTNGGFANHIHRTPASTGKNVQFHILKNYTYTVTENGNEILKGSYELTLRKSIYTGEMERFIQCLENTPPNVVTTGIITVYDSNKLDISDNNYDGVGSGFTKAE